MEHYHIRWSNAKLDWEAFETQTDAEQSAKQLARPHENYTIERYDGGCPHPYCSATKPRSPN